MPQIQIKDVNLAVSKKLNIDIKLVEKVNNLYYREFIKQLNSYNDSEIKLLYLGTFKARFAPVKKRIRILITIIRSIRREEDLTVNVVKEKLKSFTLELKNLWKIKNEFAIKNFKSNNKNGKSNEL